MDKCTKAVLTVILFISSPLTYAVNGSTVREWCMAAEKLDAGVVETTPQEDRSALLCTGFLAGLMESQRQKCLWAKMNVMIAVNKVDHWADGETFAQDGAYSLEHTLSHDPDIITRELLVYLNEDTKRWNERLFSTLSGFWMGFFEKYPEKKCKVFDFVNDYEEYKFD
jgi:hypothetical protein